MTNKESLLQLIEKAASKFNLDPCLVEAIVKKESSYITKLMRYEAAWSYFYDIKRFSKPNLITDRTEQELQKFSFGLMQVMGSVAREDGHSGQLVDLLIPETGLNYGCMQLKQFVTKYPNIQDAISSYNQGSPRKNYVGKYQNQAYVDDVMKTWGDLSKERLQRKDG